MIQLPIALQAYSLRKIFEDNPLQAMNIIKNAGYDGVEFYGTHYQTELYVALLRQTGLVCAGWHTGIEALENDFDATLRRNLAVGNKYICVPWYKSDKVDDWKHFADRLNAVAEKLIRYGVRTGYHSHTHDHQPVEGQIPWEIVAENTDPRVILQLDTGNCMCGGADPYAVLTKYAGRNQSIHLKPYSKAAGYEPAIGEDDIPWEKVLSWGENEGRTEWFVVEYEMDKAPVPAIEKSIQHLRTLRPL